MSFVLLQLKIKTFSCKTHKVKNYITLMSIQSDHKELFKKCKKYEIRLPK